MSTPDEEHGHAQTPHDRPKLRDPEAEDRCPRSPRSRSGAPASRQLADCRRELTNRWRGKPRRRKSSTSSAARRQTCSRCSTRSWRTRTRLCDAHMARSLRLYDGERTAHGRAVWRQCRVRETYCRRDPSRRDRSSGSSRMILERQPINIADCRMYPSSRRQLPATSWRWSSWAAHGACSPCRWCREGRVIGAHHHIPARRAAIHAEADRSRQHLRQPGGDRDRERAPVQRDEGSAGAADRDRGHPAGNQRLADGHPAGAGRGCQHCRPVVRGVGCADPSRRR